MTTNKTGEHTAGPWTASRSDYDWYVEYYNDGRQRTVTKLSAQGIGLDRAEANARLIAAAPQLLEALQEASDVLAEIYAKYSTKIGPFATQAQKVNGVCRAAIAAATGGKP